MSEESTETTVEETPATTVEEPSATTPTPTSLSDLEPKMKLSGTVNRLELYGAFIDIGIGVNALIHISQLGREHVNRVSDVLNVGDEVSVWVDKVDAQRNQVMVTMIEPLAVEWRDLKPGQVFKGTISRLESFGAFIDIGAEREGLVHISELSHDFVKHPGEVLSVGNEVEVQVLNFSRRKRRIDLSIKALEDKPEAELPHPPIEVEERQPRRQRRRQRPKQETFVDYGDVDDDNMPTAMEIAMRKAMGDSLPDRDKSRRRRRREKKRAQQEDILNRTLQMQQDN